MDAQEAMKKLGEGNARFVSGKTAAKNILQQRQSLISGQKPFAIVLTCSDSRVAPEHIFDVGLGEIFVIRTAGNVADQIALGSIEYAAVHLGSTLLLVMGHEGCGAVKAACASDRAEGNIDSVVKEIREAVKLAGKDVSKVISENVRCVIAKIRSRSPTLSRLEKDGKLKVAGAVYSLSSGQVSYV